MYAVQLGLLYGLWWFTIRTHQSRIQCGRDVLDMQRRGWSCRMHYMHRRRR